MDLNGLRFRDLALIKMIRTGLSSWNVTFGIGFLKQMKQMLIKVINKPQHEIWVGGTGFSLSKSKQVIEQVGKEVTVKSMGWSMG